MIWGNLPGNQSKRDRNLKKVEPVLQGPEKYMH